MGDFERTIRIDSGNSLAKTKSSEMKVFLVCALLVVSATAYPLVDNEEEDQEPDERFWLPPPPPLPVFHLPPPPPLPANLVQAGSGDGRWRRRRGGMIEERYLREI